MVKAFFGCSMRGGYKILNREKLAQIVSILESLGLILASKHQVEEGIIDKENKLTKLEIHEREYKRMLDSDIGVFEISNPSLGVGSEISDMVALGKPVICLHQENLENLISANILGKEGSEYIKTPYKIISYGSLEELEAQVKAFLETLI